MVDNIKAFDIVVVTILAKLYKNFPEKINIECELFCAELEIEGYSLDKKIKLCSATMEFLQENGFVLSNTKVPSIGWAKVGLTMKGLSALRSEPQSLKKGESIGEKLKNAFEVGSIDLAVQMSQNALNALFNIR